MVKSNCNPQKQDNYAGAPQRIAFGSIVKGAQTLAGSTAISQMLGWCFEVLGSLPRLSVDYRTVQKHLVR